MKKAARETKDKAKPRSRTLAQAKAKPRGRAKGGAADDEGGGGSHPEIPGLFLLAGVLVTGIALVSHQVNPSANVLGPWLGRWWADHLNSAFGLLPVLFYLAALGILGGQLLFSKRGWKPVAIAGSVGFLLGLVLSIHNLGRESLTTRDYQVSGGWVGNFLAQRVYIPVFGTEARFGPYLVTLLLIGLLTVWAFKLSVAAWVKRGAHAAGAVGRAMADGWRSGDGRSEGRTDYRAAKAAVAAAPWDDEETTPALARASRPARGAKRPKPANEDLIPTEEDSPEEEKAKLEALLDSGNLENLDPLTIRKLRDLALERQRITELNDWEEKTRSTEIGGMLSRNAKVTPREEIAEIEEASLSELLDPEDEDGNEAEEEPEKAPAKLARRPRAQSPSRPHASPQAPQAQQVQYDPYALPDLDKIFPKPPEQSLEFTEAELLEQKELLEAQLNNFKVRGKVTGIHPGPVITRYEVELAPGEKVNRISALSDDLALALRAKSIRILAPIPGKSLVGVEVPNRKAQIVYIKEILTSEKFAVEADTLKVALGKNIAGEPYVTDLTRAPHLLIAGQTGSGKSVCINSIMASLLASKSPEELRMILIDPKVVELKPYEEIPHLLGSVITNPETAVQALKWATVKMDERYEKLAQSGVRNIKGFNEKVRNGAVREEARYRQREEFGDGFEARFTDATDALAEAGESLPSEKMPYILIIIDELADLMMVAGKEVETNIARIAQKARAVGIHLILATQRPSTNVITGTIKANLPTRIAFQVASQIDARTILDRQGAEKLLGRGDMLYRPIESPDPERLHGAFLDDAQCEAIAEACAGQNVNYPKVRSFNVDEDVAGGGEVDEERDEKFVSAAELVVQLKQASVSLLQRRLGVGYAKAGRIVDQLERAGIVGRERGSKPREVLMDEDQLQGFLRSHDATSDL